MEIRDTKKRWLRIIGFGLLMTAAVMLRPNGSRASDVGFRVGYMFDAQALSVGMEYLNSLDNHNQWFFNPNAEIAMGDERNVAAFNGDFHYDFDTQSDTAVWAGAGPALLITDPDGRGQDTEVDPALNMLLGIGAKTGTYRPYAQVKGILSDNSDIALAVGIRF
jgi:hypothetical protein